MLKIITFVLGVSATVAQAGGSSREEVINSLTYRDVGKAICYNTKIMSNGQVVDASIRGKLQEVRGREVQIIVTSIQSAERAPSVLVMEGVSYSRGELVWSKNNGWFVC